MESHGQHSSRRTTQQNKTHSTPPDPTVKLVRGPDGCECRQHFLLKPTWPIQKLYTTSHNYVTAAFKLSVVEEPSSHTYPPLPGVWAHKRCQVQLYKQGPVLWSSKLVSHHCNESQLLSGFWTNKNTLLQLCHIKQHSPTSSFSKIFSATTYKNCYMTS